MLVVMHKAAKMELKPTLDFMAFGLVPTAWGLVLSAGRLLPSAREPLLGD
jgi:hypothetical protein